MPLDFLTNLHSFYLVRPSLRMKAAQYLTFGTVSKYISGKIQYISTIEELSEKLTIDSHKILNVLPLDVRMDFAEE